MSAPSRCAFGCVITLGARAFQALLGTVAAQVNLTSLHPAACWDIAAQRCNPTGLRHGRPARERRSAMGASEAVDTSQNTIDPITCGDGTTIGASKIKANTCC